MVDRDARIRRTMRGGGRLKGGYRSRSFSGVGLTSEGWFK